MSANNKGGRTAARTQPSVEHVLTKPLRADADRNRRRVLSAAAEAFAEHGVDVSTVEIARRAGVGQGTLYRRFPTKEHLVAAVVSGLFDDLTETARQLAEDADAERAVYEFLAAGAEMGKANRGFVEVAAGLISSADAIVRPYERLVEAVRYLVRRAQREGVLRKDVVAEDIIALIGAIGHAGGMLYGADSPRAVRSAVRKPADWRRYLDLVFDGLRPEGAHPLSQTAPSLRAMSR